MLVQRFNAILLHESLLCRPSTARTEYRTHNCVANFTTLGLEYQGGTLGLEYQGGTLGLEYQGGTLGLEYQGGKIIRIIIKGAREDGQISRPSKDN